MTETAALLADAVLPEQPLRQWVLSLPMALRVVLATRPAVLSEVLGVVYRTISGHLQASAGVQRAAGHTGAVTLIQRFGSALNLNVHFHMIFIDGVYVPGAAGELGFRAARSPSADALQALVQQRLQRVFGIEIERCARCGARLKIATSIEDSAVIARILAQGDHASDSAQEPRVLHAARAPPGQGAV